MPERLLRDLVGERSHRLIDALTPANVAMVQVDRRTKEILNASVATASETVLGEAFAYPAGKPKLSGAILTLQPGAETGWHTHGWPYFVVLLTDAIMKIEANGAVTEARWKAGQSYRRPAGVEHDVLNGSDHPIAFVEIEIKQPEELGRVK